jgi:hypothetical protein
MTERSRQLAPTSRHARQFAPSAPIGVYGWRFAHAASRQVRANESQPTAGGAYGAPPRGGHGPCRSLLLDLVRDPGEHRPAEVGSA